MTETTEEEEVKEETPKPDESLKDYASRRLVELKNYEQQLVSKSNQLQTALNQTNNELVSCRAVIGEMTRIINDQQIPPPTNP